MFDGSLPEIADLAALADAALIDAVRGWAQAENAACARKQAVMAELLIRARCEGRYATSVFQPLGVVQSDLTA